MELVDTRASSVVTRDEEALDIPCRKDRARAGKVGIHFPSSRAKAVASRNVTLESSPRGSIVFARDDPAGIG